MQVRDTIERELGNGDPPCPILKREQSPSPPPLSPIPSDINKKTDEKPPSLLHHQQEEEDNLRVKDALVNGSHQEADMDTATEEERAKRTPRICQAEENPNGTLLQDVVNRFTEKLETIRPLEKDPPLGSTVVCASEKEVPQSPSTSHNLQFHADAHLAEIITTVLHSGRASDYNLSELFNRHDSKEPKSPNTRSRRRQEVLAAMATPNDDASTRRHTLQIKRELAMFDPSLNRKKVPPAKKTRLKDGTVSEATLNTSSDSTPVKEESKRETEEDVDKSCNVLEGPLSTLSAENNRDEVKEEIQTVIVTEEVQIFKAEEKEMEISNEGKDFLLSSPQIPSPELKGNHGKCDPHGDSVPQRMTVTATSAKPCDKPCEDEGLGSAAGDDRIHQEAPSGPSSDHDCRQGEDCHLFKSKKQKCRSQHSEEARRSRRNIVPPKKFSSYVTEPRKMFFVACFSESIFNQKPQKEKASTCTTLDALSKDPDAMESQLETRGESLLSSPEHTCKLGFESTQREQCGQTYKESDSTSTNQVFPQTVAAKEKSPTKHSLDNGSDSGAKPYGRLRSSFKRVHDSKTIASTSKNTSNMDVTIKSAPCVETPPNCQLQYTSPIKLMFVSPVQDKEGVRYSLKSAGSDSSGQAEEPFDPCEESSWSGTPKKLKTVSTESATSKVKSISSPLKSATSPARSACSSPNSASSPPKSRPSPARSVSSTPKSGTSPAKSVSSPAKSVSSTPKSASTPIKSSSSPAKSASPKSASSSPKGSSRRSGEGTPTKRAAGAESQRSPGNSVPFHDTTPPKRRPGRPKKLGPQLEQKVKRPIGRPRKQKAVDLEMGGKTVNGKSDVPSEVGENVNKNLKITVVYGRSRRNKRTVSEGFDQLQTEFHDAFEAVGLKGDLGILMHNSNTSSGSVKTASTELSEELNFVSPVKESAPQSSSNIKCQKRGDSLPSRKPGRPAKVKISGISVTVTTVSPRQRKIQINRDTRQSPDTLIHKKALLPEFNSAKEPRTISHQLTNRISQTEEEKETKEESKDKRPNKPVAVRHSMRVRKPSIHFLHAVATSTSRSYRRSNALLQRSKQLLLNKASNERRQSETASGEKRHLSGQERKVSQDLSRVARVSVDSIFTPKETLKWWAASTEEKTMNQELARRIRLISDTWVPDIVENQDKEMVHNYKQGIKGKGKSKHLSVVRTLFNCPPNKPRSCSMQQLCSWFMQTTETQSLAIVKKASSRNPYELMHFPRSANKNSVCRSPQAERLRKHIKKFAKIVPKSPLQHKQAQRQLRKRNEAAQSTHNIRRQLFTPRCAMGRLNVRAQRRGSAVGRYLAILLRARTRFLTLKERDRWRKRQKIKKNKKVSTGGSGGQLVKELQTTHKALRRSAKYQLSNSLENSSATGSVDQTQEPVDVPKEQNLCSKAWSPEKLKECRVFLRKINSPDNESTEEEWDSCTVTLDDGSPSAYVFTGRERELVGVVKAVKSERKRCMKRTASRDLAGSAPESVQEQDEKPMARQKGKYKSPGVVASEPPQPPPAKTLRQSRMRGLSGPRWCDFVFEN